MGATELGPVFHDKVTGQVLDCVRQHHETLVRGSSREDFVTECIWSKILDFMFKKSIRVRITASQLEHYMNSMLDQVESRINSLLVQPSNTGPVSISSPYEPTQSPPQTPDEVPPEFGKASSPEQREQGYPWTPRSMESSRPRTSTLTDNSGIRVQSPDRDAFEDQSPARTPSYGSNPTTSQPMGLASHRRSETSPPRKLGPANPRHTDLQQFPSTATFPYGAPDTLNNGRIERDISVTTARPIEFHKRNPSAVHERQTEKNASTATTGAMRDQLEGKGIQDSMRLRAEPNPLTPQLTVKQLRAWATLTRESRNSVGGMTLTRSKDFRISDEPKEIELYLLNKMKDRDHASVAHFNSGSELT